MKKSRNKSRRKNEQGKKYNELDKKKKWSRGLNGSKMKKKEGIKRERERERERERTWKWKYTKIKEWNEKIFNFANKEVTMERRQKEE